MNDLKTLIKTDCNNGWISTTARRNVSPMPKTVRFSGASCSGRRSTYTELCPRSPPSSRPVSARFPCGDYKGCTLETMISDWRQKKLVPTSNMAADVKIRWLTIELCQGNQIRAAWITLRHPWHVNVSNTPQEARQIVAFSMPTIYKCSRRILPALPQVRTTRRQGMWSHNPTRTVKFVGLVRNCVGWSESQCNFTCGAHASVAGRCHCWHVPWFLRHASWLPYWWRLWMGTHQYYTHPSYILRCQLRVTSSQAAPDRERSQGGHVSVAISWWYYQGTGTPWPHHQQRLSETNRSHWCV